jgi:hypothetical protein
VVFDGKEDRMRNLMGTPRANIPSSSTFPTYTIHIKNARGKEARRRWRRKEERRGWKHGRR